jgi:arylsulfatase
MKLIAISLTTLALSLFGTSGIAVDSFSEAKTAERKPNIVLILMDNRGYGELGCYGGSILRGAQTTRIDKLASEGMRLLNYNVEAQPKC